jgi:HEAT repeat protein
MSDGRAAPDLLAIVKGNGSTLVRANAARALAKCGDGTATSPLVATMTDPRQPLRVRQEIALSLGAIGDPSTAQALISTVEQASREPTLEGEQLRVSAIQALGRLHSAEAHTFLGRYAQGNLSPTERAFVVRAYSQGG